MERVPDPNKGGIVCDLLITWGEISDGVTVQISGTRGNDWSRWGYYCIQFGTDPHIQSVNPCEQAIVLIAFMARVRTGDYVQGDQVCIQYVADELATISKTCQLVGKQSSIYQIEG